MINSSIKLKLKKTVEKYNLSLFVLFGSRANNTNLENSDWDFAFITSFKFTNKDYSKLKGELYKITNSENVDLINLDEQDNPVLRYEIFNTGLCIYELENGLFDRNQTNVWYNYIYFKPEIEERNKLVKENLKEMINNEI